MKKETFAGCFAVLAVVVLTPASAILSGWVLSKLWAWFMVPALNLPALTIPAAIGISLVVSYLTYHTPVRAKETQGAVEAMSTAAVDMFLRPLLALFFGWIVQGFTPGTV